MAAADGGERQHSQQLKNEVEYEAANGPSSEPLYGGRPARTTGKRKPAQRLESDAKNGRQADLVNAAPVLILAARTFLQASCGGT